MPTNVAKQIAEELLANNLVLQNKVRIICQNDLAPGQDIQKAVFDAVPSIPKADTWQVVHSLEEYDLLNIFKQPILPAYASGGSIVTTLLAAAIIKEMKLLVLASAPL